MLTITVTTEIDDGPETSYQRVVGQKDEDGDQKYEYVPTGRIRKKTVEVFKQQLETLDMAELILAVNQPHIIARASKMKLDSTSKFNNP
jgi:hypothetical protein